MNSKKYLNYLVFLACLSQFKMDVYYRNFKLPQDVSFGLTQQFKTDYEIQSDILVKSRIECLGKCSIIYECFTAEIINLSSQSKFVCNLFMRMPNFFSPLDVIQSNNTEIYVKKRNVSTL
jgi:hypothetical protein